MKQLLTMIPAGLLLFSTAFAVELNTAAEKRCGDDYWLEVRTCNTEYRYDETGYDFCLANRKQDLRTCCEKVGGSQSCSQSANLQGQSFLAESRKDMARVMSHPIFQKYENYIVDNYREGEFGEAQAFFVRLVKPFSTDNHGVCFVFLGPTKLKEKPRICTKAE